MLTYSDWTARVADAFEAKGKRNCEYLTYGAMRADGTINLNARASGLTTRQSAAGYALAVDREGVEWGLVAVRGDRIYKVRMGWAYPRTA